MRHAQDDSFDSARDDSFDFAQGDRLVPHTRDAVVARDLVVRYDDFTALE